MKSLTQHIQQKAVTGTQLIGDVGGEALLAFTLVYQMRLFIYLFIFWYEYLLFTTCFIKRERNKSPLRFPAPDSLVHPECFAHTLLI